MAESRGETVVKAWLASKGWKLARFQQDTMNAYLAGKSGLLNAPTGTGKSYALFLPVLADYINHNPAYKTKNPSHLQVIWLTPLRALTKDLKRNLQLACDEMEIPWTIGVRTGDMSAAERTAQKKAMPEVLLTTPESLHLMFAQKNNASIFKHLKVVIADEWHELLGTKRGTQTELAFAHLRTLCPRVLSWGMTATIGNLDQGMQALTGMNFPREKTALIRSDIKKKVVVQSVLPDTIEKFPWAGYMGTNLMHKVIPIIMKSKTTLIFTNTRSQTEIWYRLMMERYTDELAGLVALHHGSLDREIRDWVEDRLHTGKLKAVICTSSLDLGVDFRPVETVIQVGSPKSVARFLQRAGRSGHRPDAVSTIYFVPTHALELIEGVSLREGVRTNILEERIPVVQAFDVLSQYMVTLAVGDGFKEQELFEEIRSTFAYQFITRDEWEWLLGFITTGGASLQAYDEFKKVEKDGDLYMVTDRKTAMRHRLSMGTIVSDASIRIRYLSGKYLGSVESFVTRMKEGDVFSFAGMNLEFIRIREMTVQVRKTNAKASNVPRWQGGRVPLSSQLSAFIRERLEETAGSKKPMEPEIVKLLPLLKLQSEQSAIPSQRQLLVEQTKTSEGFHVFIFPFEGRLVHEGMASIIAYRISKIRPITFSMAMNDYGFELLSDVEIDFAALMKEHDLFTTNNLLDDIAKSINANEMARRKFREIASIAGMVFQGYPGKAMKTKHLQSSSSLLFDVISEHEKDNLLVRQAYQEALDQQLEEKRLRQALLRIHSQKIIITHPPTPTPFAFPILVDRMREQLSSEKLEDRVNKLIVEFEKSSGNKTKK